MATCCCKPPVQPPDGGPPEIDAENFIKTRAKPTVELDDLGSLGASAGATGLIRVAASDGYHTTLAVSNAFTVQDQPPKAFIVSPELTHIYPAGESVPLRGGAMDPETGGLSGSQLAWSINGLPIGSDERTAPMAWHPLISNPRHRPGGQHCQRLHFEHRAAEYPHGSLYAHSDGLRRPAYRPGVGSPDVIRIRF
jgi:hypothetical protein